MSEMLGYSLVAMLVNIFYAFVAVGLAAGGFRLADKFLVRGIDTLEEIRKGNVAAAIVMGFMILGVSLIIGLAMR